MLKLDKVTKYLGDKKVLDEVSFELKMGEVVGLLGPNGAGKTTTMRALAGYFFPDEGKIEFEGKSIYENFDSYKSNVGFMPESNPLYKELSVKESLDTALDFKDIKDKEIRRSEISRVVKATGLKEVYYKRVSELSKGYKQRLGLAIAIIGKPKIIILDEPTEGLDPIQRNEIRNLIKSLAQESLVLMSTHVLQEVEAICSKIILINKGKIIADGSIKDLKDRTVKYILHFLENYVKQDLLKGYEVVKKQTDNGTLFEIEIKGDLEIAIKMVNETIRSNKLNILSFHQSSSSLEELFVKLKEQQ
jgi:ABC-2 type transport system ATP-binding protein